MITFVKKKLKAQHLSFTETTKTKLHNEIKKTHKETHQKLTTAQVKNKGYGGQRWKGGGLLGTAHPPLLRLLCTIAVRTLPAAYLHTLSSTLS